MTARRSLLIACGEPAVREALQELEAAAPGHAIFERVLVPGGCWWLAEAATASGGRLKRMVVSRTSAVEAVSEMLADSAVATVALAGHQDCGWYRQRHPRLSPGELVKRVGADIYTARDELLRLAGRPLPISMTVLIRSGDTWEPRALL